MLQGFPTGSPDLLRDVIDLLYDIIIHRMTKKIKSKLDGTNFFINYDILGPHSKWNHSKIPLLTHAKKWRNITSQKSRNSRSTELVNLKNA